MSGIRIDNKRTQELRKELKRKQLGNNVKKSSILKHDIVFEKRLQQKNTMLTYVFWTHVFLMKRI